MEGFSMPHEEDLRIREFQKSPSTQAREPITFDVRGQWSDVRAKYWKSYVSRLDEFQRVCFQSSMVVRLERRLEVIRLRYTNRKKIAPRNELCYLVRPNQIYLLQEKCSSFLLSAYLSITLEEKLCLMYIYYAGR